MSEVVNKTILKNWASHIIVLLNDVFMQTRVRYFFTYRTHVRIIGLKENKKVFKLENKLKEKNRLINPNTTGYRDRKMAKWQGLILSEHSELIKEEKRKRGKVIIKKEKQTVEVIYHLIDNSYSQKKVIAIQLDCLFNGRYEDDIVGVVAGYYENYVYIQTRESGIVVCELDLIRNVEEYESTKWFRV